MAQDYIKINGVKIWQPDCEHSCITRNHVYARFNKGTVWKREIYTDVYGRTFPYAATDIPMSEASKILQMVAKGKPFDLHYFSVYHNEWRTAKFYVGQVSDIKIQTLEKNKEKLSSFSFNAQGVNPI